MKILSNKVWEAILDIARENDRKILELETENKRLKRDLADLQNFCMNFSTDHKDFNYIDFPNSETEIWNGPKGKIIQPKGTFKKIFNDPDDEDLF